MQINRFIDRWSIIFSTTGSRLYFYTNNNKQKHNIMTRGAYIPQLDNTYYREPKNVKRIHYEYVSKYRRITVLEQHGGFTIIVEYKNVDVKNWSTQWGVKSHAISWAKSYANNREIRQGMLTIKEPIGIQTI